jgi:hypothetical protein
MDFVEFPKMPRLSRDIIISEKIDGTNGQIAIEEWPNAPGDMEVDAESLCVCVDDLPYRFSIGSRNRWITPSSDNYGFARFCYDNAEAIIRTLGRGRHFGEWWGQGIQRGYGLKEKRFSLFNPKWKDYQLPEGIYTVPVLYEGPWFMPADDVIVADVLGGCACQYAPGYYIDVLKYQGSVAAPGFMDPEGIVVWHTAGNFGMKKTIKDDNKGKGQLNG